jgi:hypothetical protein
VSKRAKQFLPGRGGGEMGRQVAQTMYAHVGICKNNKIKKLVFPILINFFIYYQRLLPV